MIRPMTCYGDDANASGQRSHATMIATATPHDVCDYNDVSDFDGVTGSDVRACGDSNCDRLFVACAEMLVAYNYYDLRENIDKDETVDVVAFSCEIAFVFYQVLVLEAVVVAFCRRTLFTHKLEC